MNEDTTFGYSLALVAGDIALIESGNVIIANGVETPLRTLQLIHGKANLMQALVLRVQTPAGSDILNTTYGLPVQDIFTRPGPVSQVKEYIKLSLVQTLATDPRVHDVREILFADDPRYLAEHQQTQAEADAMRRSRSWSVEVAIDTLDAQTATLSLTIGV